MAYIVGADRYQTRMVTTSLDDLISKDNSVRVIDSYGNGSKTQPGINVAYKLHNT